MSGIVGSYSRISVDVSREDVAPMLDAIMHRGPDGRAIWCDGPAALGHCALHLTPESVNETLPLRHDDAGVVLTCDARIDNRDELIARLDLRDRRPALIPDSALILGAYLKWGLESPRHLIGDFAFALWDPRRERMVLARDVVGIKPLYYHVDPERAYFASEPDGLFAAGEVLRVVNEKKLADLLVPEFVDTEQTCYRGVLRVPRAHVVVIEPGRVRKHQYYQFDTGHELSLASDAEYEEAFRTLFEDAVRCRLRDAPRSSGVATTLSGGLDSSAVTCVARRALEDEKDVHTFSAVFPTMVPLDPQVDERPFINAVLASGAFVPHLVEADNPHAIEKLLSNQRGDLVSAPNLYMTEALFEACQEVSLAAGSPGAESSGADSSGAESSGPGRLRVVLSGFDGDVTVSYGYEYLTHLARDMQWDQFADEITAFAGYRGVDDVGHYFRQFGAPVLAALAARRDIVGFARSAGRVPERLGYSQLRLWRRIGLPALLGRAASEAASPVEPFRVRQVREITHPFMQYLLDQFDLMSARRGIEQRYPFFDRRLIEFCLAVPLEQRFRNGRTRSLLRRSLNQVVPAAVLERARKGTMGINARVQVAALSAELGPTTKYASGLQSYLDPLKVEHARAHLVEDPAGAEERDLFTVFLALSLTHWLAQTNVAG